MTIRQAILRAGLFASATFAYPFAVIHGRVCSIPAGGYEYISVFGFEFILPGLDSAWPRRAIVTTWFALWAALALVTLWHLAKAAQLDRLRKSGGNEPRRGFEVLQVSHRSPPVHSESRPSRVDSGA